MRLFKSVWNNEIGGTKSREKEEYLGNVREENVYILPNPEIAKMSLNDVSYFSTFSHQSFAHEMN